MANLELSCSAALQPAVRQQYGHFSSLLISHQLVMRRLLLQSPNRTSVIQHSNDLAGAAWTGIGIGIGCILSPDIFL